MKSGILTSILATTVASIGLATPPPPTVALTASTFTGSEANGTVSISVTYSGPKNSFSIDYTTSDGTADPTQTPAVSGTNYTGVSGTLFFTDSQRTQTIPITILDDA